MSRLIDADVLKKDLTRFYANEVTARNLIDEQPTVDAEIVVRCQNCKHHGSCGYEDVPGWYCADGEPRRGDSE